jgi:hypothetical protein
LGIFEKLPQDKLLHFIAGFLIYFILLIAFKSFIKIECICYILSFVITCIIGLIKEYIVDKKIIQGDVDIKDSGTTTFGAALALIISCLI